MISAKVYYCVHSGWKAFSLLCWRVGYVKEVGVSSCLFRAESHDRHGWEGPAGSFQSHSRVWPLTGALHFGRGRLIHTYTQFTHGECFAYRESVCVCMGVCDVCD